MAGLLLVGGVVLVVVVGLLVWLGDDTHQVEDPSRGVGGQPDPAGAARTLHRFAQTLAAGDHDQLPELAPAGDESARERLTAVAHNARELMVEDVTARYVDELGPVAPNGTWKAAVDLTWRFAGFDQSPVRAEVAVTFRAVADQTGIASFGGAGLRSPPWLTGPLRVARSEQALVMVRGSRSDLTAWQTRVRRAIEVTRAVLPGWRPRVTVVVPGSGQAVETALDAEKGTYANIAAVTTTADGTLGPAAPVRVYVNPQVAGSLRQRGAQVVMSHELVHVATDAVTATMPVWLLEGFADYVALRDVDLPLEKAAAEAIEQVRHDGVPKQLPGPEDLDTRAQGLQGAYEMAWLACLVLAETAGEDALVAVYRAVSSGTPTGRALRRHAGMSVAELTNRWRERVEELAR